MTTEAVEGHTDRSTRDRSSRSWAFPPVRIGWGAIFAGVVAAFAMWMMLSALGVALGLTAINPQNPESLRGSGIFTGVWGLIAPLLALFVGGLVAGHVAGPITRGDGAFHGLVMWGLTTVAGLYLMTSIFAMLLGGAGSVATDVGWQVGRQGGASLIEPQINEALSGVNQQLQARGKQPITADQAQAAVTDAMRGAVVQGELDRDVLAQSLARNTSLSEAEADMAAAQIVARYREEAPRVATGALEVAESTGLVFWGIFGILALGLAASVGGAVVGVTRRQRIWAAAVPVPGSVIAAKPTRPVFHEEGRPGEVYP